MLIMGVETSCDETAAALVKDGRKIFSNVTVTQIPYHRRYGGVVPEVAARKHLEAINSVIEEALYRAEVDARHIEKIAVTVGPGLMSSLLVGITAARTMGIIYGRPVVGINHILAHLYANCLFHDLDPPYIGLVASGGHCDLIYSRTHDEFFVLARTQDDAPGETFDKIAKMIGRPYPGGAEIEKIAKEGDPDSFEVPFPKFKNNSLDFSFSGIKTFVRNKLNEISKDKIPDLMASFQKRVAGIFADRILRAVEEKKCLRVLLAGGVMANSYIISRLEEECSRKSIQLFVPPPEFCTDNAAMIACRGFFCKSELKLTPQPDLKI